MSTDSNTTSDLPWLFAATAQQLPNAMALARAGGKNGHVYTYVDEAALGSGFEAGGGSPPLGVSGGKRSAGVTNTYLPPSPPSSFSPPTCAVRIPLPHGANSQVLPPSPSASFCSEANVGGNNSNNNSNTNNNDTNHDGGAESRCGPVIPLINSVFPYAASHVASTAHMLEIVTPPDNVLKGFIVDQESLGRCVFVHLPPTLSAPAPERLAPHFSDVLRPHDPRRDHPVAPLRAHTTPVALDIRESLTALLDLADTLEATQLLLVLDKDERETALLAELMHALMFVGGAPVRPGMPVGEWDWDSKRWALVSIEL